jgi:hypothetical protein
VRPCVVFHGVACLLLAADRVTSCRLSHAAPGLSSMSTSVASINPYSVVLTSSVAARI